MTLNKLLKFSFILSAVFLLNADCRSAERLFASNFIQKRQTYKSQKNDTSKLEVSFEITDKSVSDVDADLYAVDLSLKISILNKNKTPMFIYKNWSAISHIWISRNLMDAENDQFAASINFSDYSNDYEDKELKLEDFTRLEKGQIFVMKDSVRLFVKKSDENNVSGSVLSGDYVMQINLETWNFTKSLGEKIQNTYKKKGNVLTGSVKSEPTKIHI